MPSSKPAGALTLASRTLKQSARSSVSPHAAATDPAAAACTVASPSLPRADLVRSRLLARLGRAVCLRVWSGVDVAHLTSRALCLSRWRNAVMRARGPHCSPAGVSFLCLWECLDS